MNEKIKVLDQSYLKGEKCKLMIRVNEKNLAIQTKEGVEIIEITSGVRQTLISHKTKVILMQPIPLINE